MIMDMRFDTFYEFRFMAAPFDILHWILKITNKFSAHGVKTLAAVFSNVI